MVKQSELEVMVCDLFVDAYRAGQSCGDLAYNAARGTRAKLIEKISELYVEIEDLKKRHNCEIANLNQELEDERHHYSYLLAKYMELEEPDDIPDDGDKFSEQDLPFPDVEPMAASDEVLGGEE